MRHDKKETLLIFGGTGSLGNNLVRRLSHLYNIIIFSRDENKHWIMKKLFPFLTFVIGDIRIKERVKETLLFTQPDKIIIASALKHIDICENNISECIETNINGIKNVLDSIVESRMCSLLTNLDSVVFVSTDKATSPVNVYGMCKSICERIVAEKALKIAQLERKYEENLEKSFAESRGNRYSPVSNNSNNSSHSENSHNSDNSHNSENPYSALPPSDFVISENPIRFPRFLSVRYGNVINSRGSIFPLFNEIGNDEKKEFFPVTDPDMTRFFITLDESIDLILTAMKYGKSGDTFIPKIKSFRIGDVANCFSEMYNKPVKIIGIRPGEKKHECLINESERYRTIMYDSHYVIKPCYDVFEKQNKVDFETEYTSNLDVMKDLNVIGNIITNL